jgi:membrane protein implicated in regulation of membrane protease activity
MAAHWVWWVLGMILIGAELVTGTLYLFAAGVAFLVCGLLAWLGVSMSAQLLVAGVLSVAGSYGAYHWRARKGTPEPQRPLDVGQSVQVQMWRDDGTARVLYRGTQWDAELAQAGARREPTMYIVGTRGSTLLLAAERPA